MSETTDSITQAADVAVATCWEQWLGLFGRRGPTTGHSRAAVDPEALLLASLSLRTRERRLDDMLLAMAEESRLLSVQRTKTLARLFPKRVSSDLSWFASVAKECGDARWLSLATSVDHAPRGRPGKSMPELALHTGSALWLRLRLGLGVGIKTDLINCLGGLESLGGRQAAGVSTAELQQILGYSKAATRTALEDMARSYIVRRLDSRPARFVGARLFLPDTGNGERKPVAVMPPPWGYATQLLAVLVGIGDVLDDCSQASAPDVVVASRLRDLHDQFSDCWSWFGADPVDARIYPGERFLEGFGITIATLVEWARQRL